MVKALTSKRLCCKAAAQAHNESATLKRRALVLSPRAVGSNTPPGSRSAVEIVEWFVHFCFPQPLGSAILLGVV